MGDLISRSALWKAFDFCGVFIERRDRHIAQGLVEEAPAIEAVPVVHAEWIDTMPEYHGGFRNNSHRCSNCSDYYTTEPEDLFFCPRCGADMRKKVQDGKID